MYLFTSERLGFRTWSAEDIPLLTRINTDPDVMAFFPSIVAPEETAAFVMRMQQAYDDNGYCYFAADRLDDHSFIGFIGLSVAAFPADFTPCTDIGWRLDKQAWHQGYATEGAQRCLHFAFEELKLEKVYAIAPEINLPSIQVMKKAGMQFVQHFNHPRLKENKRLERCVLYRADAQAGQ